MESRYAHLVAGNEPDIRVLWLALQEQAEGASKQAAADNPSAIMFSSHKEVSLRDGRTFCSVPRELSI